MPSSTLRDRSCRNICPFAMFGCCLRGALRRSNGARKGDWTDFPSPSLKLIHTEAMTGDGSEISRRTMPGGMAVGALAVSSSAAPAKQRNSGNIRPDQLENPATKYPRPPFPMRLWTPIDRSFEGPDAIGRASIILKISRCLGKIRSDDPVRMPENRLLPVSCLAQQRGKISPSGNIVAVRLFEAGFEYRRTQ